jgi:hypothetical protein
MSCAFPLNYLVVLTVARTTREDSFGTILYSSRPAAVANAARTLSWAIRRTLANFVILDEFANLDDNSCPFVARTFYPHLNHFGEIPVPHREMYIGQAETGDIHLDEDILWA